MLLTTVPMLLTTAAIQASLRISICLHLHHDPAPSIAMAPQLLTLPYAFFTSQWVLSPAETQLQLAVLYSGAGHFCGILQGTCKEGYRRLCNISVIFLPLPWPAEKLTRQPHINTLHKWHKEHLSLLHSISQGWNSKRIVSLDTCLKKTAPQNTLIHFQLCPLLLIFFYSHYAKKLSRRYRTGFLTIHLWAPSKCCLVTTLKSPRFYDMTQIFYDMSPDTNITELVNGSLMDFSHRKHKRQIV